jgi:threonine/homoserine/homoserine lactone efflux protein
MGFAGYVSVCVLLYFMLVSTVSLHVSAYMAIFRCVGYFIFICLKYSASLLKERANRQTHTQGNSKNNEGKQGKNTNGANQKSSEAESFKRMKIKYPTHMKMAM